MRRLGRFIWLIVTMLLVAFAIAFATSNEAVITLYLWPFDGIVTTPIWLAIMSSFIIGGLFSISLMWAHTLAIRARLWNLQGKFNRLEAEMTQQQSVAREHSDNQANRVLTASHASTSNIKDQKTKTFLSKPLRTDHILR